MDEPATGRVYTFTPLPDLDGFQGMSGDNNQGLAVSIAEINSSFIVCENK
jgi:hypothetical protein